MSEGAYWYEMFLGMPDFSAALFTSSLNGTPEKMPSAPKPARP